MDIIQKTRDDYNKIARHFSGTRYDLWPELEQFKPFVQDGQQILDWGCGNGRLLLLLKDCDISYYGVDQSKELLKIAERKHAPLGKERMARFYCTAHKEKNFPPDFFDLVFMIASFHHLPDKKSRLKLLKKTFTELKMKGRLIITVWNLESDWAKEKIKKGWKQMGDNDFVIPWKNPEGKVEAERYYHHFSQEEMKELLEEAGFAIERMGYNNLNIQKDKKEGRNLMVIARKS